MAKKKFIFSFKPIMDISQTLIDAQSHNIQTRTNAENNLKQLEQQNLPNFLTILMQELSSENKPPTSRRLAGLLIKNALYSKNEDVNDNLAKQWLNIDPNLRNQLKSAATNTLGSPIKEARQSASQVVSCIGAIELPENQWPELISLLVSNVTKSQDNGLRQSTLESLGYLCEELEAGTLTQQANLILTAIVHGMRSEETNEEVRLAAITAMLGTLFFISNNMKNENERNFIMKVICENTQHSNENVKIRSFQCLCEIADIYYNFLPFYIQQIFNISMNAITKDKETIGMQAIEFWITLCERELNIEDENESGGKEEMYEFVGKAMQNLMPIILESLTKQDEDPESEESNIATQSGTLLRYMSTLVRDKIVSLVLPFITKFINDIDWRKREAATFAFGAILDGPESSTLGQLINQAFPILLNHMRDKEQIVKDTAAWTLASICELHPEQAKLQTQNLMMVLVEALKEPPKVASRVCHALHNLAEAFMSESDQDSSPLSQYFQPVITKLLESTKRQDFDEDNLAISTYEAINSFIRAVPKDKTPLVNELLPLFLLQLENSFNMSNGENKNELQSSFCGVLLVISRKLGKLITPNADRMMGILLKLFGSPNSSVHEDALLVIGTISTALGPNFERYLQHLLPFLLKALQNFEDYHVCSVAVSILSDLCNSVGDKMSNFCDQIVQILLQNLKAEQLNRDVKPQILSCFGDIALAIESNFEKYFNFVMDVLFQAAQTKNDPTDLDYIDWVNDLREGVLTAYVGITQGLSAKKSALLVPHIQNILQFILFIWQDNTKSDEIVSASIGLIGDIAQNVANLNPNIKQLLKHQQITFILEESMKEDNVSETAEWAIDIIKNLD
eukprot:TRINITY_DN491_c0_g1_i1.p1 TRINITY_DN491_c0_g1~~TRINITY_DN491_c0_g1_i1.p1  ORF type:complete len:855 (-),score=232.94 TRINITY_DN491_c0_g1_i1:60-2624(-)